MWKWIKKHALQFVKAYERFADHDGWAMTAAVAYYLGLSFLPMLLILIAALGLFLRFTNSGQNAQDDILAVVKEHLSPAAAQQARQALDQVRENSVTHGPLALVIMLFSAIPGFVELVRAFDRTGGTASGPARKGVLAGLRLVLFERFVAFLLLCGLGLLVVAVFITGMVLTALEQYTKHFLPGSDSRLLWRSIQIGATFGLNTALFTLMYHWLPKENVRLRDALRGGLIAAVVWEIGRQILSAFLIGTRYTNAYGVVGSFIGLMLWFYYAIAVLLLGAEYIQVTSKPKAESRPQEDAPPDKQTYEMPATHTSPAPPSPAPSLETETAIGERSIKVTLGLLLDH